MLVECIKGQGMFRDAVVGIELMAETREEDTLLSVLLDSGVIFSRSDKPDAILLTPAPEKEEEPEKTLSEETSIETGHYIG